VERCESEGTLKILSRNDVNAQVKDGCLELKPPNEKVCAKSGFRCAIGLFPQGLGRAGAQVQSLDGAADERLRPQWHLRGEKRQMGVEEEGVHCSPDIRGQEALVVVVPHLRAEGLRNAAEGQNLRRRQMREMRLRLPRGVLQNGQIALRRLAREEGGKGRQRSVSLRTGERKVYIYITVHIRYIHMCVCSGR